MDTKESRWLWGQHPKEILHLFSMKCNCCIKEKKTKNRSQYGVWQQFKDRKHVSNVLLSLGKGIVVSFCRHIQIKAGKINVFTLKGDEGRRQKSVWICVIIYFRLIFGHWEKLCVLTMMQPIATSQVIIHTEKKKTSISYQQKSFTTPLQRYFQRHTELFSVLFQIYPKFIWQTL